MSDFEMWFYNGTTLRHSVDKETLEITFPSATSENRITHKFTTKASSKLELPSNLQPIFKHMQDCLWRCIEVEKGGQLDSKPIYPIILKSSRCKIKSRQASASEATAPRRTRSAPTPELPTPVIVQQSTIHLNGACSDEGRVQHKDRIRSSICSVSLRSTNSGLESTTPNITCRFIEGLGWCVRTSDIYFTMLFEDGIKIVLDSKNHWLEYYDNPKEEAAGSMRSKRQV